MRNDEGTEITREREREWDGCLYDFSGTLAWRDGFKTGPGTPNGQDAFDNKLCIRWKFTNELVERKSGRINDHDAQPEPVHA